MSASQRILCTITLSSSTFVSRNFLFLRFSPSYVTLALARSPSLSSSFFSHSIMPHKQPKRTRLPPDTECASAATTESVTERLAGLSVNGNSGQTSVPVQPTQLGSVQLANQILAQGRKAIWKPKSYGTVSGGTAVEVAEAPAGKAAGQTSSISLGKLFKGNLLESFNVDNSTYCHAQIRATFYPKFENEKTDGEIRTRMIEMVSKGLATLEVSLKHSGSLFMYAGHEGGAYAKNSFGNMYA